MAQSRETIVVQELTPPAKSDLAIFPVKVEGDEVLIDI